MPDLSYHVGVVWRVNTGAMKTGNRFVRFGLPGIPDFEGWFFRDLNGDMCGGGSRFSIEGKAGKDPESFDQKAYALLAHRTDVYHGIVRSYDECASLLESFGLKRPV